MDWVLDKVVDQSDCEASVGNTKITDLVFADDAVIFAESLEVLVMALEALHEEAKPLGLEVSWLKTKVQVFGDLLDEAVQFSEVGSNADVFSTIANNIEVTFHQSKSKTSPVNNSFRIVITTFKYIKEVAFSEACRGKYPCRGSENYCISPEYVCDSHYNCAVPSGGGDEVKCKDPSTYSSIFSTTTTIITSLASIVGAAFLIGCIITLAKKMHAQSSSPSRSTTPRPGLMSDVSAPPMQRQHTLPPYEAVVMADADPSWKPSTPETPAAGELPPNYESLFPDGPPKNQSDPPATVNQPSTTTAAATQEEHNPPAATAPTIES
ncbi:hypothetical protein GWK47_018960 [Chionoecetes opilio]|uniref:Uncharacterized protein n=1 Tax=Chionoecetes opilio TaxID=41210 RepID=A0A8J4XSV9_CHIOP|nr:hypothetical protein GWK47_018960 [Chionoecetes opilio]